METKEPYYALNQRDKKQIKQNLQEIIESNFGNMSELSEYDRNLLIAALEKSLTFCKIEAKKKYTSKKYRNC
ncbi:hypothetical protein [Enterococcus cecorum]|uniref:hypothetical protein n=1 Tax=Enterococcus cecorum TaxID=44008 RepID=UPI003F21EFC3